MARAASATHTAKGVDAPRSASIDLRQVTPDVENVRLALESVASVLGSLRSRALVRGDLAEVERLVGASHAVHGAIVALAADSLIAARSSPPRASREAASAELERPCRGNPNGRRSSKPAGSPAAH
jgi:hypothetical protein